MNKYALYKQMCQLFISDNMKWNKLHNAEFGAFELEFESLLEQAIGVMMPDDSNLKNTSKNATRKL